MKALSASVEDVFREAAARWTLLAYFGLSSLFILLFAGAVNLDIVNGALAGARLFGRPLELGSTRIDLDRLVLGFESGFSAFLFVVATFLAVFATAHLVPRLQEKGTIDLYLSRPVGRVPLLLSRYLAGLLLAGANVAYLIGSVWAIVAWKTGVVHLRFLLSGAVILLAIAVLLAFAFLAGVVTSSTGVSIMGTYGLFFVSALLVTHQKLEAAVSREWIAAVIRGLYWALPKTADLGRATVELVGGGVTGHPVPAISYVSTALFALACLWAACALFRRKDF